MYDVYGSDVLMQGGRNQMVRPPVTKCDTGTQTDTHFVERNIVKSYEWNEWELRRKAIKLVGGEILQLNSYLFFILRIHMYIVHNYTCKYVE